MSTIMFRIYVVLIGAMITIAGTRALATCNTGCNFGSDNYDCYGSSGQAERSSNQTCQVTFCVVDGCGNPNRFTFCIGSEYLCQMPACSWNSYCGCSNG